MRKPSKEESFKFYKNIANTKSGLTDDDYLFLYHQMFGESGMSPSAWDTRTIEDVKQAVKTGVKLHNPVKDMPDGVPWD